MHSYEDGRTIGEAIGALEGAEGTPCFSSNVRGYYTPELGEPKWNDLPRAFKAGAYVGYREAWAAAYAASVAAEAESYWRNPPPPPAAAHAAPVAPMPDVDTYRPRMPAKPPHLSDEEHHRQLLAAGIITPVNFNMGRNSC